MDKHTQKVMFSKKSDEWCTPDSLYLPLNGVFHFTLDPASDGQNAKCIKYFTIEDDGLLQSWKGEMTFINPPYSKIKQWVLKSKNEGLQEDSGTMMLIPARTETKYFQDIVFPFAKAICFIRARIKFSGHKNCAPFPSVLCYFSDSSLTNEQRTFLKTIGSLWER